MKTLVWVEHEGGAVKDATLSAVTAAAKLGEVMDYHNFTLTQYYKVEAVDYQGQAARYFVRVGDQQLQVINMIDQHPFEEGSDVSVRFRPRDCAALPGAAS